MIPSKYSTRLGNISHAQFQKALERFSLGDFIRADPVPYGLFGQNVFLTSSKGNFVFRGAPHSARQFPTECFFTNLLHQHTKTPVAYPYLLEPATDVFGWSYVLMPRLPGLVLQDPNIKAQLTLADRLGIARAVAKMLVEIQTLHWDCCGSFQVETNRVEPFEMNYRERVVRNIHEKLHASMNFNEHTTRSDQQYIEAILAKTESVLRLPFQPSVVLGDYGEHNLVVEKTGDSWRVSGVFDLMTAHFGDGAADISSPMMGYLKQGEIYADAFLQEYRSHTPAMNGFAELQQLYMLDLTLSFWQYFQKHEDGLPEDKTKKWTFEQWAKPFIEYWEPLRRT
jgi:hygromycin-B 7''-O-kinase